LPRHELALDGQRVLEQLVVGGVQALGLEEHGRQEPRGSGKGDLERTVGDRVKSRGLAGQRVVDLAQAAGDARHAREDERLAGGVAKAHGNGAGPDALAS
jgi:hypothetical protein